MSAYKLHGEFSCDKCMLVAKPQPADCIAALEAALAVASGDVSRAGLRGQGIHYESGADMSTEQPAENLIAQAEALEWVIAEAFRGDHGFVGWETLVDRIDKRQAELRAKVAQEQPADWQHLKPFGYAPGNYMNKCQACKVFVYDLDKRALAAAQAEAQQLRDAVESWEGYRCEGHCQADPCHNCDGTMWRSGKGKRLEDDLDEARAEAAALRAALRECRSALWTVCHLPGDYDLNADPHKVTSITGKAFALADSLLVDAAIDAANGGENG